MADADFPRRRVDAAIIARLNQAAAGVISDRLRAAVEAISGQIVFTTSFGIEDQLITHHILSERLPIEIVTLDTGRLFPATYKVWQETEERYGARIRPYYPDAQAVAAMVADSGINGFYFSKDARVSCCEVRKVEPLRRALSGAAAWIVGLRADQSGQRAATEFASWDAERALMKIAPVFDRSREDIAEDCEALGVPVNALHAQGYLSIGCEPCTRAILPGEPERAGRWWWESDEAKECGLHVDSSGRLVRSAAQ